jgi:DNA transposition AAA+ family ATPase
MNQDFIVTKEHRRFTEFANAVRKEKTLGICHGDAGVGKTNSARSTPHHSNPAELHT